MQTRSAIFAKVYLPESDRSEGKMTPHEGPRSRPLDPIEALRMAEVQGMEC